MKHVRRAATIRAWRTALISGTAAWALFAAWPNSAQAQLSPVIDTTGTGVSVDWSVLEDNGVGMRAAQPAPGAALAPSYHAAPGLMMPGGKMPASRFHLKMPGDATAVAPKLTPPSELKKAKTKKARLAAPKDMPKSTLNVPAPAVARDVPPPPAAKPAAPTMAKAPPPAPKIAPPAPKPAPKVAAPKAPPAPAPVVAKAPPPAPKVASPTPKAAPKAPPAPAPVVAKAPPPAPKPVAQPKVEAKPEPAPAPKPEPKAAPQPTPIPVPKIAEAAPPPPPVRAARTVTVPLPSAQQTASAPSAEPLKAGDVLRVAFPAGDAKLPGADTALLDSIADRMNKDKTLRLQLKAYAGGDDLTASKARRLSLSRALSVRSYLIEKGVRSTRIDVRALGNKTSEQPVNRVDLNVIER